MGNACGSLIGSDENSYASRRRHKRNALQPFREAAENNRERRERHRDFAQEYRRVSVLSVETDGTLDDRSSHELPHQRLNDSPTFPGTPQLPSPTGAAAPGVITRNFSMTSSVLSGTSLASLNHSRRPSVIFVVSSPTKLERDDHSLSGSILTSPTAGSDRAYPLPLSTALSSPRSTSTGAATVVTEPSSHSLGIGDMMAECDPHVVRSNEEEVEELPVLVHLVRSEAKPEEGVMQKSMASIHSDTTSPLLHNNSITFAQDNDGSEQHLNVCPPLAQSTTSTKASDDAHHHVVEEEELGVITQQDADDEEVDQQQQTDSEQLPMLLPVEESEDRPWRRQIARRHVLRAPAERYQEVESALIWSPYADDFVQGAPDGNITAGGQ